jgi:hypothetical protein
MTTQTKRFIELQDVLGLRFECKECHASLSLPLTKDLNASRLRTCPHCNNPWLSMMAGPTGGSTVEGDVTALVDAIKRLDSRFDGSSGFPVGCSLLV